MVQNGSFASLNYDRLLKESVRWYQSHPFEKSLDEEVLKYLSWIAAESLSKKEITDLKKLVSNSSLNLYMDALEKEALRMNCKMSEVCPVSPILPLRLKANVESRFADLPQDVIINIMNRLETIDIYHFTLVCRNWKAVVHNNRQELRRAEHTIEKHFITFTGWRDCILDKTFIKDFSSNLEVFCHDFDNLSYDSELNEKILVSTHHLNVFRGILCMKNISHIKYEKTMESVFGNLVALDLGFFEVEVLETLLEVDNWQLRYLRINDSKEMSDMRESRSRAKVAVERLLPKLNKLEIFIGNEHLLTTNRTIELMMELNLNLRFADFYRTKSVLTDNDDGSLARQTLITFSDALRSRCPDMDLSEIRFITHDYDEKQHLDFVEASTGFTFTPFSTLKFLSWIANETLSQTELSTLKWSLSNSMLNECMDALEKEALRPSCQMSEVGPVSLTLPLRLEAKIQSKFADLPQDIIINIMNRLETIDIFRFTLVCKNWRAAVYNNPQELRRAEHTTETHLITYARLLDCQATNSQCWDACKHLEFCWHLFKWYCNLSQNLETLILSGVHPYCRLEELLQSCPRLKNLLIIGDSTSRWNLTVPFFIRPFQLPNLEVFCHEVDLFATVGLDQNMLVSSNRLKAYKGFLCMEDLYFIARHKPLNNVFPRLIALDLCFVEVEVLETLLEVDSWQLRYLRIHDTLQMCYETSSSWRARVAVERLLPKLKKLEIWIGNEQLLTTNRTIELMTEMKLNLSFAVFFVDTRVFEVSHGERVTVKTLIDFGTALSSRCPDLDLSEIQFVTNNYDKRKDLREADTGFTFTNVSNFERMKWHDYTLRHPKIKQYLGLDF
eukprot:g7272.t1